MNIEIFTMQGLKTHKQESEFCFNKLKEICEKHYNFKVEVSDIIKGEHGKPYFKNNEKIHFNISHSKGMGIVVVDDEPCGVDIELLRKTKLSMAERFFTEEEKKWIFEAVDEDEQIERFFTVWTGKEAYTKMLGCGLTIEMDSFNVLSEDIKSKLKYFRVNKFLICICSDKNIA